MLFRVLRPLDEVSAVGYLIAYGGGILMALGWSIVFATVAGLVLTVALAVFADLNARREEVWLTESFDEYAAYREKTPRRLIPFVF